MSNFDFLKQPPQAPQQYQQQPQYVPQPVYMPAPVMSQSVNVTVAGQGGQSNAFAAFLSFCWPGLGQLVQGRVGMALFFFLFFIFNLILIMAAIGVVTAPLVWLWSIVDAARYRGR